MFLLFWNVFTGMGNTNDAAEFNFYVDPEAAYTIFEEIGCPITLVPWEIYVDSEITLVNRKMKGEVVQIIISFLALGMAI